MGVVYKARQVRLNRPVALKMILAGAHAGAEAAARFLAEAEAVAKLQHPNIVQIFHIGEHDGLPYFEMEYVGGGSLADRLDGTPRPPREAARLVETLAGAMAEAHRLGIVHRDLKPANILLTPEGAPKVADFGLAKLLNVESGLTRTDSILGSPSYMAPEQAEGKTKEVGPAADVYALGAILYELLTGRPPFRGATVLETLEQVKTAEPVPPSRLVPGLPRDVETIALKCLQKDPGRRYESAAALAEDLRRFLAGEPIVARPVGSAGAGLAVVPAEPGRGGPDGGRGRAAGRGGRQRQRGGLPVPSRRPPREAAEECGGGDGPGGSQDQGGVWRRPSTSTASPWPTSELLADDLLEAEELLDECVPNPDSPTAVPGNGITSSACATPNRLLSARQPGWSQTVAFSPDGRRLASASERRP